MTSMFMVRGPPQGYLPEPTNIILVVSETNLTWEKIFFSERGLTIVMGSRHLGGYIGDDAPQMQWLGKKVKVWEGGNRIMAGVAHKHLKAAYVGLKKSLQ